MSHRPRSCADRPGVVLQEGCTADEEHRELAGIPGEVVFATKPQPAGELLDRAHSRGVRAASTVGDEVYGDRELRRGIWQLGMGYVMAVRASHHLATSPGHTVTVAGAVSMIPRRLAPDAHRVRDQGVRQYDWAMLEVTTDDAPTGTQPGTACS